MISSNLQPSALLHDHESLSLTLPGIGWESPKYALGFPGLNPKRPTVDLITADNSGSVVSPGGTDPIGNRFQEAWRAITTVAGWANRSCQVGLLPFDQPSTRTVRPGPLSSRIHLALTRSKLCVPSDARGSSDLGPSLAAAEKVAATHPESDVRWTILSDFQITDDDPNDIFRRIIAFPGTVHAVVLGSEPPIDLRGANIVITRINPGDAPGSLATAIHRSLTATRPGRRNGSVHINTHPSIEPLSPQNQTQPRSHS